MGHGTMRSGRPAAVAMTAALMAMGGPAWSAPVPRDLLACGDVADGIERLACFDRYLASARVRGVESSAPAPRASTRPSRPAPVREVVSTVGSVLPVGQGRWTIELADQSVWQSYDASAPEPRAGQPVHIRKGTFGSYLADIGGARGVVLKRVR